MNNGIIEDRALLFDEDELLFLIEEDYNRE